MRSAHAGRTFFAACALLLTRRIKPEKILARVDWSLLVFFAALFVTSGVMEDSGITLGLMNGYFIPGSAAARWAFQRQR